MDWFFSPNICISFFDALMDLFVQRLACEILDFKTIGNPPIKNMDPMNIRLRVTEPEISVVSVVCIVKLSLPVAKRYTD